ncbi:perforin-1, partial [Parus major]|uniref:perforin-1 n=1 Tax=Parus major TaxID=9157 RepID=UPI0007712D72
TARPSPHFLRAVRSLPPTFDPSSSASYARLLSTSGTHAVRSARLGGRVRALTAVRLCRAAMAGVTAEEASDCLMAEASFGAVSAAAGACRTARRWLEGNESFGEFFGQRFLEVDGGVDRDGDLVFGRPEGFSKWLRGVPEAPAVVQADLWPLHALVPPSDPRRAALRAAIGSYVAAKALRVNCSCGRSGHTRGQWSLGWSVVNGQWSGVSGQWSVVSGQWSGVSGQWSVVSGQWSPSAATWRPKR